MTRLALTFILLINAFACAAANRDGFTSRVTEEHDNSQTLQTAISETFTSFSAALGDIVWPFVTSPAFAALSTGFLESTPESKAIIFCPVVTADDKSNWQLYSSLDGQTAWMEEVSGVVPDENAPSDIYSLVDGQVQEETGSGPFCPVWQHAPLEIPRINFNLLSVAGMTEAFTTMSTTLEPAKIPITGDIPFDVEDDGTMSWLVTPVLDQSSMGSRLAGLVVSIISEESDTTDTTLPPSEITDSLLQSISASFSPVASALSNAVWPFITNPIFSSVALSLLEVVPTNEVVLSCPIVAVQDRRNWEQYSFTTVNHGWIDELGGVPDGESVSADVFRLDEDRKQVPETDSGSYCPVWQHVNFRTALVNWNLLSVPEVANAYATLSTNLEPVVTPVSGMLPFSIEDTDESNYFWQIHPILNDNGAGAIVVGLVVSILSEPKTAAPSTSSPTAPPSIAPVVSEPKPESEDTMETEAPTETQAGSRGDVGSVPEESPTSSPADSASSDLVVLGPGKLLLVALGSLTLLVNVAM